MLGIVFTGGESPPPAVIRKVLDGKKAFVVAADSGLVAAEKAGIKPDLIIGDMDSVDVSRLNAYPAECVIRHARDKDYTDTELALTVIIEKGIGKNDNQRTTGSTELNEIWLIGGGGGRIDHIFGIRSLFEREIFPSRWLTESADIRCIDANRGNTFSCCVDKGATVSVFPLGDGPWSAMSKGLKWPLADLPWNRGFFGISNVALNGDFSVTAEKGRYMVVLLHCSVSEKEV